MKKTLKAAKRGSRSSTPEITYEQYMGPSSVARTRQTRSRLMVANDRARNAYVRLVAARDALEHIGRTYEAAYRGGTVQRCKTCNQRVEYCDGAFPQGVCNGQVARAALLATVIFW